MCINNNMHYLIYKITNIINNKIYIGKHKTDNKDDDYYGSGVLLNRALDKHSKDNFKKEILFECSSEDEMNQKEYDIVNEEFIARLDTYNIMIGGKGGFSYINNNNLNVYDNHTDQCRLNMVNKCLPASRAKLDMIRNDPELFDAYKEKISNTLKLYYKYNDGTFKNKKHTDDTKQKIGKANSKHQTGKGNSQYGKMWIHNLELKESKRIHKDDSIPEGWLKGRKIKF